MSDTIFAPASGPTPAAISVIRISGPQSRFVLETMAGGVPEERRATLRKLRIDGEVLDEALCLWFAGPASFTGEDMAELQVHGGRAVVAGLLEALARLPGLRHAEAGEFTRRAFERGRLDLTEVEGLADLVRAETAQQRRQALAISGGMLRERLEGWRGDILKARAAVEAEFDFADEDDVDPDVSSEAWRIAERVGREITAFLEDGHRGEIVRDGLQVVLTGRPNAGKSSLINALARRDVAIVTAEPGTTRDVLEARLDLGGFAVTAVDTAGIRETQNIVEAEGVRRARQRAGAADLVIWLAPADEPAAIPEVGETMCPVWTLRSKDDGGRHGDDGVSVVRPGGTDRLIRRLTEFLAKTAGQGVGDAVVTRARHRDALRNCAELLGRAAQADGVAQEIRAEWLREAADWIGRVTGRIDVEDVLGAIFAEFCIGK